MKDKIYDVTVLGGGPAGYTAALYSARAGLDVVLLERFSAGGQMTETPMIENYPGFDDGVDGFTLGDKMRNGAERFGTVTKRANVLSVTLEGEIKTVNTDEGEFRTKTVIIATGAGHKHLGIDREEELVGRGVGYCAACDGMLYRGKTVAVVGGGNSAASDALLLSKICKKVYLIHRRDSLRATKIYHEPLMNTPNIEFKWNRRVSEFLFEDRIKGVRLEDTLGSGVEEIEIDGLFISIGRTPATSLFEGQLELDREGYILADETTRTNIDGVFAAGDVRKKPLRQIVTAASDGAVAAHFAEEYLTLKK